jgi:signal transduction histidine kinase/ActR/RegA family two-component response regulator
VGRWNAPWHMGCSVGVDPMDRPDPSAPAPEHLVQFYDADDALIATLAEYVGTGLATDRSCLVIATKDHRDALDERLRDAGLDLATAQATGQYVAVDAAHLLARIENGDGADSQRFAEVVGALFGRLPRGRPIRVFGEMVGLLLRRGQSDATLRMETLWNELGATRAFELLCAYPLASLGGSALAHPIVEICARHSRVIPAGGAARRAGEDERLRTIVSLQRQASSLQAEVTERNANESALRAVKEELEVQVQDLRRLHEMAVRLTGNLDVESVLREVLQAAVAVPGTNRGLLSLCDSERPGLALAVETGFDREFLDEVRSVPPGGGACGTAFAERRQVVVEDVTTDPVFASYRAAAGRAGFRSCHSTPLVTRRGDIVGVLSVFFAGPRRPSERELRLMDLHARIAADAIENARLHHRLQQELEDRKQSLAREHIARAEAESANRMKDEFLATVSHELRTPLNAILGWAHILRAGKPDEATVARGVEVIERNAQTQAQLVEDILDASRVITGSLRLTRAPLDLAAVINTATDSVRLAAEAKGIELVVVLDPAARQLSGDGSRLQQMVWNLLSNAIKFTAPGGRVEIRLARADGYAQIQVIDTGEGIAPQFLPFIFDRFRQADSTITRRHGGLGLGLAIVRHLAELHEGTVHAESAGEGYGSTFTIRLPLGAVAETERPAGPAAPAAAAPLQGVQLLVVDDDHDALDMLSLLLLEAGASVRTATSAAEALALLRWIRPDVLLSDLAMPDEDGYSLVRSLRAIERDSGRRTPAVALTAYVRVQDRARAVDAGFDVFVEKPADPEELVAVIGGLVDARAPRPPRGARPDTRPD